MTVRKASATPAAPAPEITATKATGGESYHIASGDTLSAIALEAYGHASWWPAIKEFNAKKVGKNELILAGDTLKLPTKEQAKAMIDKLAADAAQAKATAKPAGWHQQPPKSAPPAAAGSVAQPVAPPAAAAPAAAPDALSETPNVSTGLVKPKAGTTPRAVAAAAFGIDPKDVSSLHLDSLRGSNPGVELSKVDEPLAGDAVVNLAGTPQLTKLQIADFTLQQQRVQQVLDEDKAAAPGTENKLPDDKRKGLEEVAVLMANQRTELEDMLKRSTFIGDFGVAVGKSENETNADAIQKLYGPWVERAEKEVPTAVGWLRNTQITAHQRGANELAGTDPLASLANVIAAKEQVTKLIDAQTTPLARAAYLRGRANLSVMEGALQAGSKTLTEYSAKKNPTVASDRPLPPEVMEAVGVAKDGIAKATAAADADLKAVSDALEQAMAQVKDPNTKEKLQTELTNTQQERAALPYAALSAEGSVHVATNDPARLLSTVESELKLKMGIDAKVALLEPTVTTKVNSSNEESWFGTEVRTLSPEQLKTITDKLATLSPEDRSAALSIVSRYAQTAGAAKTFSGVSVAAQVLRAEAKADPTWELEAKLGEASHFMTIGALNKAQALYAEVRKANDEAPDKQTPVQQNLAHRAMTGEALSYARLSQEGDNTMSDGLNEKDGAAWKLSALRQELEAAASGKPTATKTVYPPETLANLTINEIEAFLASGQADKAEETLAHLKTTYGELPAVKAAVEQLEKAYRQGGAKAFFKVLGAQGMQSSGKDMAFAAGAGAVGFGAAATIAAFTGAGTVVPGIGNAVGFIVGTAVVALGGAAAGIAALSVVSTVKGSGKAWQAGQTGLTSVSTTEALLGAGATLSSLIGGGVPFKMMNNVGGVQGLRAAMLGTKGGDDVIRVLEARAAQLEVASPGIFGAASADSRLLFAQQTLTHEALHGGLTFGAKAQGSAMLMQIGHMMKNWYDVSNNHTLPEEEKARQLSLIHQQLATVAAQGVGAGTVLGLVSKGVYRGTPAQIRSALRERVVNPNVFKRTISEGESVDLPFTAPIKKLDIDRAEVASVQHAGENVKISAGNVGTATVTIKTPGLFKPNVKVKVSVLPAAPELQKITDLYQFGTRFLKQSTEVFTDPKLRAQHAQTLLPEIDRLASSALNKPPAGVPSKKDWATLKKKMQMQIAKDLE